MLTKQNSCHWVCTKCRGILVNGSLSFKPHIQLLANWSFILETRRVTKRRLVATTFMSVLDYGDAIYMHVFIQSLKVLDTLYHGALSFITNCIVLTHDCSLYAQVGWSVLSTRRLNHWHTLIYKVVLGLLPSYLQICTQEKSTGRYCLCSQDFIICLSGLNWEKGHLWCSLCLKSAAKFPESSGTGLLLKYF